MNFWRQSRSVGCFGRFNGCTPEIAQTLRVAPLNFHIFTFAFCIFRFFRHKIQFVCPFLWSSASPARHVFLWEVQLFLRTQLQFYSKKLLFLPTILIFNLYKILNFPHKIPKFAHFMLSIPKILLSKTFLPPSDLSRHHSYASLMHRFSKQSSYKSGKKVSISHCAPRSQGLTVFWQAGSWSGIWFLCLIRVLVVDLRFVSHRKDMKWIVFLWINFHNMLYRVNESKGGGTGDLLLGWIFSHIYSQLFSPFFLFLTNFKRKELY